MIRARTIAEVAERNLCTGCGVCAYVAPDAYEMVDTLRDGRRPLPMTRIQNASRHTAAALAACPGTALDHEAPLPERHLSDLGDVWGPVLEVWEGHATDSEIRFAGSSGGVATALSVHCLEAVGMRRGIAHPRSCRRALPQRDGAELVS